MMVRGCTAVYLLPRTCFLAIGRPGTDDGAESAVGNVSSNIRKYFGVLSQRRAVVCVLLLRSYPGVASSRRSRL